MESHPYLELADWRRRVAEIYTGVRSTEDRERAWTNFRVQRDGLFRSHPQTPLTSEQLLRFQAIGYFPFDPGWRLSGQVVWIKHPTAQESTLPVEGLFRLSQIASVRFEVMGRTAELGLFWIEGYGGGLFLPFRDRTNGGTTYGGGRYLFDTIKGADLGSDLNSINLDFNFAYNPSCAYNDRWVCPLAPPQNRLDLAVEAGEKDFIQE